MNQATVFIFCTWGIHFSIWDEFKVKQYCDNILNFISYKSKWPNKCKTWIIYIKILGHRCLSKTSKRKSLNCASSPHGLSICPVLEKKMWITWIILTIEELISSFQWKFDLLVYLKVRLNKPS